jgi:phosphatidate phosphatase APP1
VLYGHVFSNKPVIQQHYTRRVLVNIVHLLRLFFVKPLAGARVRLYWQQQQIETQTEDDGFFKFEWKSDQEVSAGWYPVKVEHLDEAGQVMSASEGQLYVPYSTQYIFISDIDDTVMVSYSATKIRRLKELLFRNPRTRQQFENVSDWYQQLAQADTTQDVPNPFFYVSSSEWNLYDYLREFFQFNKLPKGIFLLNQVKRWFQFFKTGKTSHSGKLLRIVRILTVFPKQQFVFIGDNSQQDPSIYATLAAKYPSRVAAIFIRNIRPENEHVASTYLKEAELQGAKTFIFKTSEEAAAYSKQIGLLK